jgi:hypothetical protein
LSTTRIKERIARRKFNQTIGARFDSRRIQRNYGKDWIDGEFSSILGVCGWFAWIRRGLISGYTAEGAAFVGRED